MYGNVGVIVIYTIINTHSCMHELVKMVKKQISIKEVHCFFSEMVMLTALILPVNELSINRINKTIAFDIWFLCPMNKEVKFLSITQF